MTNQKAVNRVALYSRVSTNCGKQDVENQTAQLREYCQRQDWTIIRSTLIMPVANAGIRPAFQCDV